MPFEDTHSLLQFLTVAIGCAIFLRIVAREKHRREVLLEVGLTPEPKVYEKGKRPKKSPAGAPADDDAVLVVQPVAAGQAPR